MDGKESPTPWRPKGVNKSDSMRSHDSVSVVGTHPLGSLQVHRPDDSPLVKSIGEEDEDSAPPPLVAPTNTVAAVAKPSTRRSLLQGSVSTNRDTLKHSKGGGDVVLILDLPEVFNVGYDSISFTAKNFGGVKDIPKGSHFFWVSHENGMAARSGFWICSSGIDQVHIMQWDKFNEILGESGHAEAHIQADNVDAIHSKLIPYNDPSTVNVANGYSEASTSAASLKIWGQLTSSVSKDVLGRILGPHAGSWCVHTGDRVRGSFLIPAEVELDRSIANPLFQTRELNFTFNQHARTFSTAHTGADRTEEATDSTHYITSLISDSFGSVTEEQLVGEFQFAFVAGMHLGNDSCIQQWWHILLKVILRAYQLPKERPLLTALLLRTLAAQLSYSSEYLDNSIIDYSDSRAKDLRLSLTIYKRRLDELVLDLDDHATTEQLSVPTAFAGVEAVVASMGWDLRGEYLRKGKVTLEDGEEVELEMSELQEEDERGEWAPELVELDEDGRQRDLVSWSD